VVVQAQEKGPRLRTLAMSSCCMRPKRLLSPAEDGERRATPAGPGDPCPSDLLQLLHQEMSTAPGPTFGRTPDVSSQGSSRTQDLRERRYMQGGDWCTQYTQVSLTRSMATAVQPLLYPGPTRLIMPVLTKPTYAECSTLQRCTLPIWGVRNEASSAQLLRTAYGTEGTPTLSFTAFKPLLRASAYFNSNPPKTSTTQSILAPSVCTYPRRIPGRLEVFLCTF
jgi:hypothetical protein